MTKTLVVEILVGFAVAVTWISCIGLLAMRNVFQRLHFVTPIATLSSIAIAAALLLSEPFSQVGLKVLLIVLLLLGSNAVLAHATAAAAQLRERGQQAAKASGDAVPEPPRSAR